MKKIIRFLINDITTDWKAIKLMFSKDADKRWNEIGKELKETDWNATIKEYWTILFIILLAFFVGVACAATYYNAKVTYHINNAAILCNNKGLNISVKEIINYKPTYSPINNAPPLPEIFINPQNK